MGLASNYVMLVKEIKDLSKRRDTLCSWIERLTTVKTSILPKRRNRLNAISNRLLARFCIRSFEHLYGETKELK